MTSWNDKIETESNRQIAIDFDGVIHTNDCSNPLLPLDGPVEGAREALERINRKFDIIVFTCRGRKDRPNDGIQTVIDWLDKHDMLMFVKEVTAIKPRATAYIDDKGVRFTNWNDMMEQFRW